MDDAILSALFNRGEHNVIQLTNELTQVTQVVGPTLGPRRLGVGRRPTPPTLHRHRAAIGKLPLPTYMN